MPPNKIAKISSIKQSDFDDSEFELSNMSNNNNINNYQSQLYTGNKNVTTSKQLPQVPTNQMTTVITTTNVSSSHPNTQVNLTKKYTSMDDDDSDENNENWF